MGKEKVKIAFVGLGGRGYGILKLLLSMEDIEVLGVSDLYEDRAEAGRKLVLETKGNNPVCTTDYRKLLEIKEVEAVITPSAWTSHGDICIDSMLTGKYVATEVGGATSVQQCWELVRTSERTGIPCMMLENCCYGREEMTILNMVKKGLFGELVHAEGGYRHDLRDEVALGRENRHYRQKNYLNRNGDVYPTHELGPIAKYMDLNRGNRMLSLTSTASKSVGINEWIRKNKSTDYDLYGSKFALGDVVTTVIKCAHGETIVLFHDTSLPRPYSRGNLLQGTNGIWNEDKAAVSIEGLTPAKNSWDHHSWQSLDEFYAEYEHPLWKQYREAGVKAGHGGMDYLVLRAFINAVRSRTDTPIDVYDTASWMAITTLSEDSVAMGSAPVAIPDFTNGKWIDRRPPVRGRYCLEEVCEDSMDNEW
ncbi:MAG: glycosyl hydrolase [Clostridiales bacterium GWF2_38_85]|nr:MAG: glycosyl hydrolase [Clostridiales bacterium GWF2_38_85]HBL83598.1 glycosyl hydrolase [Clostridiales bacterium]